VRRQIEGLLAVLVLLAAACTIHIPPGSWPVPPPTATRTPAPAPEPMATPRPEPAPAWMREGRFAVRIDLRGFRQRRPDLDYFTAATLWHEIAQGRTSGIELNLRNPPPGPLPVLCTERPCPPGSLGLVVRVSSWLEHDSKEPSEHKHKGEGINARQRLAVGPDLAFDVEGEVKGGCLYVRTPVDSAVLCRGVPELELSRFDAPFPRPRGIGWGKMDWSVQDHGGMAELLLWEPLP
jgi:hypothetical protein